ncbi:MAG: 2-phospho-L-lactate transferase [Steroidobacteraceae bacterium]|jgi:LPPG:FO 2-phospho-L-lactate transferase
MQHIVALCGGVGGAKLADGLNQVLAPGALSVIVNTGDDFEHRGLPICPDLDTVLYTLAGVANPEQGWGRADETWQVQAQWRELGVDTWFQLGDRDIALHLYRRELQSAGMTLTEISRTLAQRFRIAAELLPMCDQAAPTTVSTELGELPFQEYFVRHRCAPAVRGFRYGAERFATLSGEVRAALERPDLAGIVLCPSNPYLSIAPILAVPGLKELLRRVRAPVIAVSPLIAGAAVKGPAAKIMNELALPVSALEIARQYRDFLDVMLIDEGDRALIGAREAGDPQIETAAILMRSPADRRNLAQACLEVLRRRPDLGSSQPDKGAS